MSYQRLVLSVVDTYAYLRDTYRELATQAMVRSSVRFPASYQTVLFDPAFFLTKLVQDINLKDERPNRLGQGPEVTVQILVDAGVPSETARWMYHQAWTQITDQIATHVPDAVIGAGSPWEFELTSGVDLVISLWVDELPQEPRTYTTIAEELQPAAPAAPIAIPGTRLSPVANWLLEDPAPVPQITSRDIQASFESEYGRPVAFEPPVAQLRHYGSPRRI